MSQTYAHDPVHVVFSTHQRNTALPQARYVSALKICVAPTALSSVFFLLTHGDAVGYPVVAPDGARTRKARKKCSLGL